MEKLQPFIDSLQSFAQKRLNFERPPKLFLKQDKENAMNVFGKTAFYDPNKEAITLFVLNRHPKDILRSLAHELVHHTQNLRGDLTPEKCGEIELGYAQDNDHMREMEREAYEQGNLCFRDWEDNHKQQMQENKIIKENNKMSVKISKKQLKEMIGKILSNKTIIKEQKYWKGKKVPDYSAIDSRREAYRQARRDKEPVFFWGKGYHKSGYEPPVKEMEREERIAKAQERIRGAFDDPDLAKLEKDPYLAQADVHMSKETPGEKIEAILAAHPDLEKIPGLNDEDQLAVLQSQVELKASGAESGKELAALEKTMDDDTSIADQPIRETRIQTPESEKALHESLFGRKNQQIFNKLKDIWTKTK